MKDIIIVGAGGIGREVAWIIEEINELNKEWNILGFIDDNEEVWGKNFNDYKVLGGIDYLNSLEEKPHVVVAMANPKVKKKIIENLNSNFKFSTIIHPTVKVGRFVEIGQGTIIYPGTIITVNSKIGENVLISGNCSIGHDTTIEDYSSILWGSNFSGYNNIGKNCTIGVGVILKSNCKVCNNSTIEAGSIIDKNVTS